MSPVKLAHRFWFGNTPAQGIWSQSIFSGVESLSKLERNLVTVAFPKNSDDLFGHDPHGEILGDGWEGFNEIFNHAFGMHPEINFVDFTVCPPGNPGYDFEGLNLDAKKATQQSKFVSPSEAWSIELAESEKMKLERFRLQSIDRAGVDPKANDCMTVFTNAKDIHWLTRDKLLSKKVRCIGRAQIEYFTKNPRFWQYARECIQLTNPGVKF